MTDRKLYTLTIPADSQTSARTKTKRNTSKQGVLDEDVGVVESLSTDPDRRQVRGQYRGVRAELMATELAELFEASQFEAVGYAAADGSTPVDGYYTPETLDVRRLDPREGGVVAFKGAMSRAGTRESHRRAVETAVVQVENDFGNEQTASIGIPAKATDVRWFDRETGQTEPVSTVETRAAEHGDVNVVGGRNTPFDDATLVYDLPYADEGKADVVIWDDHSRAKYDGDALNTWQRAFSTAHEFSGVPVVDNSLVRVHLDASAGLSVESWDSSTSSWSSVALGTSNWSFDAWDITRISPTRVTVQCRFVNSSSSSSPFHLDMSVKRGWQWPQWTVPTGETPPTPSGLQDLLSPVADGQDYQPQSEQGLIAREEVRA
ncbi:hypothetical protein [Halorussus sp. MSC15.2]|uniref:hypothetical protein n=1 Tax=Halorussus sp. MSC15.2 TaxID=2283638 RepID=UPI0013D30A8B|nr:hypothetical protein [Halorussus sp. MSC15.2]NEU57098.1 hypothetical protein [Halorussus sp. MSC15.2]